MTTSDIQRAEGGGLGARIGSAWATISQRWKRLWRIVAHYMPKRLYARSLIIVIAPMILLQSVVAFVFMERHWQTVTQRLSAAVTRDISAVLDLIETFPREGDQSQIIRIADKRMSLDVDILADATLPKPVPRPLFSILEQTLSEEIRQRVERPFWLDTVSRPGIVEIRIQLDGKVLRAFVRRGQTYASNTHIFLVWMVGTSLVLLTIAIPFLRNQIRPILALAEAAESFGKGRPMPADFKPRGADEVRRAGHAFIQMRERIERAMEQRTAMLTGVSHDLRTILTRFKLQLALSGGRADVDALDQDVRDMQSMLEGYLAFARGEAAEEPGHFDLDAFFEKLKEEATLRQRTLEISMAGDATVQVRPNAFARLLANVAGNALRYATTVRIAATHTRGSLKIVVDDDGPGIPADKREDVFKPFLRLDEARNLDASGTGLGLSIARDIARSHGGDVTLSESPLGGLRAVIRVPA